jgi:MraZ protein
VFYGESSHAMDAKGRVHLPRRFQSQLACDIEGNPLGFLTLGFEGCLFLFSEEGYRKAIAGLDTQPFVGEEARTMQRLFFSKAHLVQLDAAGRLLIPEVLRKKVGLEKDLVMIGIADRAEIWPREAWERYEAENEHKLKLLDQVLRAGPVRAQNPAVGQ